MKFNVNGKIYEINVTASQNGAPAHDEENYIAVLLKDVKDAGTDYDADLGAWIVDPAEWGWIVDGAKDYAAEWTSESACEGWEYEAVITEI